MRNQHWAENEDFFLLSNRMEYDRGSSFPFDFEPNGFPFFGKNWEENCDPNHIPFQFERKMKAIFMSAGCRAAIRLSDGRNWEMDFFFLPWQKNPFILEPYAKICLDINQKATFSKQSYLFKLTRNVPRICNVPIALSYWGGLRGPPLCRKKCQSLGQ